MIFILLPLLTRALNVTGYARTDVQGRFWEETYDCQGLYDDWNWSEEGTDEERRYCDAFKQWLEQCLEETQLDLNCDDYDNVFTCRTRWHDPKRESCSTYEDNNYCTKEGEYGHGYNDFVNGAFKPGTNDLDAFEACIECGACSEDKFLESDEYNDFKTGEIIGSIVGAVVGFICFTVFCYCYCKERKSEDVPTTGTAVTAPAPVQPVMQPTTTVVINNGFQQAPNQFQPQQVSYQIE